MTKPYEKMRVKLDRISGKVNLTISYRELRCILTGDCLNAYAQLDRLKTSDEPNKKESVAYFKSNIKRAKAIEQLLDQQLRPEAYQDEVKETQALTKANRMTKVKEEIKERKFMDDLLQAMLAEGKKRGTP